MVIEDEAELQYVPRGLVGVRFAFAASLLMLTASRSVLITAAGVVVGAGWWAVVGLQRRQEDWWLGFILAALAIVGLFFIFAAASYSKDRRSPSFVKGRLVRASVSNDILTFDFANRRRHVRVSEVDKVREAFGFVLLTISSQGVYLIAPRELVPDRLLAMRCSLVS
jgi:hypothetical protein